MVQRGPPEAAVRLSPGSAQALSRAAEAELVADRADQAEDLAGLALRASPFDLRALRVLGLVRARRDEDAADELITLAGNWSLRDDPSHAWLMTRRLRQGDYVGAFGHADTLARRRSELRPGIFEFFTAAATLDPRAMPVLLDRVAAQPNWRTEYLDFIRQRPDGPVVQAALAVGLDDTPGRLSDAELDRIYLDWLADGRIPGLRALRLRLKRPDFVGVHDGEFDGLPGLRPFMWDIGVGPGLFAAMDEDPTREGQRALLVQTDGFGVASVAAQLLMLDPGSHQLSMSSRVESDGRDALMTWSLTCLESGRPVFSWTPPIGPDWRPHRETFVVPAEGCSLQWLRLSTVRGERRTTISAAFDGIMVGSAARSPEIAE